MPETPTDKLRAMVQQARSEEWSDPEFAYSVVIPTKDRPAGVDRALRLLCEQSERPVEIIIVDASEQPLIVDPTTRNLLAGNGISLRLLTDSPSTARQRNAGVDVVTTPLVLFLDDDIILDPDYVAGLLRRWRPMGLEAIAGISGYGAGTGRRGFGHKLGRMFRVLFMLHVEDTHSEKPTMRRSGKLRYGLAMPDYSVAPAIGSGAPLFRTELVRRHRFSDRFGGYVLGEDLDLSVRVAQEAPVLGTSDRYDHHHAVGGKHSPLRWYYRGRPETYFRLRNRHLTELSYPAFWVSVFAEGGMALLDTVRERDHRHVSNYARGVRESVQDIRREQFVLHSRSYYAGRALYDRARLVRRPSASSSPLSPGIRILGYHRVAKGDALGVAPDLLRRQLESALARGAEAIPLTRALDLLEKPEAIERSYVAVTFDDGYLDNLEQGLPILEDLQVPATISLVTAIADARDGFHWYHKNQPAAIRWADARELAGNELLDFQPHGRFHRRLTALSDADARDEIAGAKEELERELGTIATTYCYAAGVFGDREVRLVREAGYRGALTTNHPGVNHPGQDLFRLDRIMVTWSDNDRTFAQKLSGSIGESRLEHWVRQRRQIAPLPTRD